MKKERDEYHAPSHAKTGPSKAHAGVKPEGKVMNRWLTGIVFAGILAVLIGCSPAGEYGSWAPPSTGPEADCERSNGVWRAALNFCEYPRASVPDAVAAMPPPRLLMRAPTVAGERTRAFVGPDDAQK